MVPSNLSPQLLRDATRWIEERFARPRALAMTVSSLDALAGDAPILEEDAPAPEPITTIGPIYDRGQAREWALVLQSQSISFTLFATPMALDDPAGDSLSRALGGWVLKVNAEDYERALTMIDLYEHENENWPPPRHRDRPRHEQSLAAPLAFLALGLFYLYVTGPVARGSHWFTQGRADAALLFSEPWRMVTALTLHADGEHILGNALSGSIFGMMLSRRVGPGGALLSILLAGTLGNTINALYHLNEGHRSIGASTAVFATVGILAAVQTLIDWGRRKERGGLGLIDMAAPLLGGLTLLGMLGAGKGNTDVWAHGFGFLSGIGIGTVVGLWVRRHRSKPSQLTQGTALVASAGIVIGAWALALIG